MPRASYVYRSLVLTMVLAVVVGAIVFVRSSTAVDERPVPAAATVPAPERADPPRVRHVATAVDAAPRASDVEHGRRVVVTTVETHARLAGAVVSVERADGTSTTVATGSDGVASLPEFPADTVAIRASAPGRARRGWFADEMRVGGPVPPEWIELPVGGEFRGRTIDAFDGRPLAGVAVAMKSPFHGGYSGPEGNRSDYGFEDRTTSDGDGVFVFPGVPCSEELRILRAPTLTARFDGYADVVEKPLIDPPMATARVVIRMERAAPIRGRVVGPDGSPAADAEVVLHLASHWGEGDWSYIGSRDRTTRSNARGEFAIGGVEPGSRVSLRALADGRAKSAVTSITTREQGTDDVVLRLGALVPVTVRVVDPDGVDVPECSVELLDAEGDAWGRGKGASPVRVEGAEAGTWNLHAVAAGFAAATKSVEFVEGTGATVAVRMKRAGAVWGVVTDDVGAPVPEVSIAAGPAIRETPAARTLVIETETAADGTFRIEGVADGFVALDVDRRSSRRKIQTVRVADSPIRVVLKRPSVARGRLVPPNGGEIPHSCRAYLRGEAPKGTFPPWESGGRQISVDGAIDGDHVEVSNLPAGRWSVELRMSTYLPVRLDVQIVAGETTMIPDIVLDAGVDIDGRVVDPAGGPVGHAHVKSLGRGWESGVGATDASGRFRIALRPGPHLLGVEIAGTAARVAVEASASTSPVTLVLAEERPVRIAVHDARGEPVVGWHVAFPPAEETGDEKFDDLAWTDARGVVRRSALPGRYVVGVLDADKRVILDKSIEVPAAPSGDDPGFDVALTIP